MCSYKLEIWIKILEITIFREDDTKIKDLNKRKRLIIYNNWDVNCVCCIDKVFMEKV